MTSKTPIKKHSTGRSETGPEVLKFIYSEEIKHLFYAQKGRISPSRSLSIELLNVDGILMELHARNFTFTDLNVVVNDAEAK